MSDFELKSKISIPAYVSTARPTFVWSNSTDPDSDTITYQIQLAKNFDWSGPSSFTESNIVQGVGHTEYQISGSLDADAFYNWRIRAYDGYEYSEWSSPMAVIYAVTTPIPVDLGAKLVVKVYRDLPLNARLTVTRYSGDDSGNLGASVVVKVWKGEDLGASVTIPPYSDLKARIDIFFRHRDLPGKIYVIPNSNLAASVTVGRFLFGKIFVIPMKELKGRITVLTGSVLKAQIYVTGKSFADPELGAKVFVKPVSNLGASADVQGWVHGDLGARIGLMVFSDLSGSASIIVYRHSELSAQIFIEATEDLGASVFVPPYCSLDARIRIITALNAQVFIWPRSEFSASVDVDVTAQLLGGSVDVTCQGGSGLDARISLLSFRDVQGRINIVTYSYAGMLAKVFIEGTKDLGASLFIPSYRSLGAKIRIITVLDASMFIWPRSEFSASVTVDVSEQILEGKICILRTDYSELRARIYTGKVVVDMPAIIDVDASLQEVGGSLTVIASGFRGLDARLAVDVPEEQIFPAEITVSLPGWKGMGAKIQTAADEQYFKAQIEVSKYYGVSVGGRIRTAYNPPSEARPSGYMVPEGYPPLPSGWVEGAVAIPGPGAQLIPEGEWQAETSMLFIWTPPEDWGYGATAFGYLVAWNDNENYIVGEQDQFVPDNFISKSWYDSGSMWFHVRAKNSHGWFGSQRSYNVKINALAASPVAPFMVDDGETGCTTGSSNPLFSWGNAIDPDQLDALDYNLQILPSGGQPGDAGQIDLYELPQASSGYFTTHKLVQSLVVGDYQWRVRAHDQKQFGPYCEWQYFSVVSRKEGFDAKIRLVEYWINNFRASIYIVNYKNLAARIRIPTTSDLSARVRISSVSDLGARINVPPGQSLMSTLHITSANSMDLGAKIRIVHASDLGARLEIKPYSNLAGRIDVGIEDQKLMASIGVCYKAYDSSLSARLTIVGLLKARIFVSKIGGSDFNASITVRRKLWDDALSARISIPIRSDIGAKIFIEAIKDLNASAGVLCDRPEAVVVTADVADGVWQENNAPVFSWEDPADEFSTVTRYYVAWNEDPLHEVTRGDQLVIGNSISKIIFDSGIRYFHIKAENAFGNLGFITTHYTVKYNHVPTVVEPVLLVEGEASPVISTVAPTFSWGNASDADQLDVISYNIQVSTSQTFQTITMNYEDVEQTSNSSRTSFEVPLGSRLPGKGRYYWRVRAYDGKQHGEWTDGNSFEVVPVTSALAAAISIPVRGMSNFKASVNIIGHYELQAEIYVFNGDNRSDLGAKATVSRRSGASIVASITVPKTIGLNASLRISPYGNLPARMRIVGVAGHTTVSARINVCSKSSTNLIAMIRVGKPSMASILARITISSTSNLDARITVYDTDHFGFIDEFSSDIKSKIWISKYAYKYLAGKITTIADRPGTIAISANVPASTWQGTGDIVFIWTATTAHWSGIEGYYTELDRSGSTGASDSFQKTEGFTRSFSLDMEDGAGIYYFHVAAKADNGTFGPTSHYAVWYNHVPTNTTPPMTVNRVDSISSAPVVSRTSGLMLEWGQSYDSDDTDSITYLVQISRTANFGVDNYGVPGIMYEQGGIGTFKHTVAGGTLVSGKYYWRVKAFDGHQYSPSWGPVASFSINSPPSVPSNLIVYS